MWFILDSSDKVLGVFNTGAPKSMPLLEDTFTERAEDFSHTLEFKVPKEYEEASLLINGNRVAIPNENGDGFYSFDIVEVEDENNGISSDSRIYAEAIHVNELSDSIVNEIALTNKTSGEIVSSILAGSEWSLGDNQMTGRYDFEENSYPSALSSLLAFMEDKDKDHYLEFSIKISQGVVIGKYVNIRLKDEELAELFEFGKNLNGIVTKINTEEVYTAIVPLGKSEDGKTKLTIRDIASSHGYEKINNGDGIGHIDSKNSRYRVLRHADTEAKTAQELYDNAIAKLDEIRQPKIEYTASVLVFKKLSENVDYLKLHSKVRISDHKNELYLEARVSERTYSVTNPENDSITLSNYKKLNVKELQRVNKIQQELALKNEIWSLSTEKAEEALVSSNNISARVDEVTEGLTQTASDIEAANNKIAEAEAHMEEISESISTATTTVQSISSTISEIENVVQQNQEELNGLTSSMNTITQVVKSDDSGIKISAIGSTAEMTLQNDGMRILVEGAEVASFTTAGLESPEVNTQKIAIDDKFVIYQRSNKFRVTQL